MGEAFIAGFVDEMKKLGMPVPKKEDEGFSISKLKSIPRRFLSRFMRGVVLRGMR